MNRWTALALLAVVVGALALRLPHLDARPMHNDEAVNAIKLRALHEDGRYVYDPHEFHGPTLYYLSLPSLWIRSAEGFDRVTSVTLRLVPVLFGIGLIVLLLPLRDGLGQREMIWAGTLTAVSPAMVFYSRYFIHEMLLVFFSMLTLVAGWRYWQTRRPGWAVLAGGGVGLMFATKETFVLAAAAMATGLIATWSWRRWRGHGSLSTNDVSATGAESISLSPLAGVRGSSIALALGAAVVVWLVFFSSFFTNLNGLPDSVRTYLPWLQRAGGESPHVHPWNFYLERLFFYRRAGGPFWSEGLILLLGVAGSVAALRDRRRVFAQFLVFYTIALAMAYCVIPYKTPWCALGFLHGLILLAGVGAATLIRFARSPAVRTAAIAALLVGVAHLGWQAWRASHLLPADRDNPYVYAQTSTDILNLIHHVDGVAKTHPDGHNLVVKVIAPEHDYGPLLWYLRGFKRVGWWDHLPADPFAPVMIVSAKLNARLDEASDKAWMLVGISELRPGEFMELYVEAEIWRTHLAQRTAQDNTPDQP